MIEHSLSNIPDDYSDDGEEQQNTFIDELQDSMNATDRFRACPLCDLPTICIESKGAGQRFKCGNAHLISVNEILLNN